MIIFRRSIFVFILISLVSTVVAEENVYKAAIDADGIQRVEILAGKYFFKTNHIIVKVNVPVEIKVRKEGGDSPPLLCYKSP